MMRVTTLKVGVGGVAALGAYYTALDRGSTDPAGYYLDEGEPPGRWWGTGRRAHGLSGEVEQADLEALLDGRSPSTGDRLGQRYGESSARAFDATFSAPKSVSLLWGLHPDPSVRREVEAAHDAAVEAALGWVEQHGCVTRRGKGGAVQVDAEGLTVALFRQHTSRSLDPQMHTHAVVLAKVQDESGKWLALDARFLLRQQRSISWIYDAALRAELSDRLGVTWDALEPGRGQADLAAVSPELRSAFSQRSDQVDAKLAELLDRWSVENDGAEPDPRTLWLLERRAVLASRPGKQVAGTASLETEWQQRARAAGFDPGAVPLTSDEPPQPAVWDREQVVLEALERVAEQRSAWLHADLAREIAALVPPTAARSGAELTELIDELVEEAAWRCRDLHPPSPAWTKERRDHRPVTEHGVERLLTTPAVLDEEAELERWAIHHARAFADEVDPQRQAAHAIADEAARLVLIVGPAGAGKTTAIRDGVWGLRQHDRPVLGLAPSGKAADVLAEAAGCRSMTLAALLTRDRHGQPPPVPPGTTIVLDEAGMARTDDLHTLVRMVDQYGWRLVCAGDPQQLPSVGRGGMFARWCDLVPHHDLDTIHRFTHAWEAHASLALRAGRPEAAEAYTSMGRVRTAHPAAIARLVADAHADAAAEGHELAITTATTETARTINEEIQRRRGAAGPTVELADGTRASAGDRVATRQNDPNLVTHFGTPVRNRHTWDVLAITANDAVVATNPERGTVVLPKAYVAAHVELGWAVTGYGNQGITTDRGLCVVEQSSTRAGIYVGLTRGREHNAAVIADPTGLADPSAALATAIGRGPTGETALATADRLHRQQGLSMPRMLGGHYLGQDPKQDLRRDPEQDLQRDREGPDFGPASGPEPELEVGGDARAAEVAKIKQRLDLIERRASLGRGLGIDRGMGIDR
jgi:conjugative relaxase-like TrwC/TraI family protein